jgi:hypothetical protein
MGTNIIEMRINRGIMTPIPKNKLTINSKFASSAGTPQKCTSEKGPMYVDKEKTTTDLRLGIGKVINNTKNTSGRMIGNK